MHGNCALYSHVGALEPRPQLILHSMAMTNSQKMRLLKLSITTWQTRAWWSEQALFRAQDTIGIV